MRARTHIEDLDKGGRQAIIVDEIPYQVNKANLLGRIGELVREKKLEGISDLRDESDRTGHARRDRAEARRGPRDRPQQPVQADAAAGQLRHEHGRAGRRPAAAAQPEAVPRVLPDPPPRGRHAAHGVRAAQGARARPHPGRPRRRAVERRRDHRADQGVADAGGGQGRADGAGCGARPSSRRCCSARRPTRRARTGCRWSSAGSKHGLPAVRRAGAGDPRAAAAAADRPRAGQDHRRVPRGDGADRRPARHPRQPGARHDDHPRRADGDRRRSSATRAAPRSSRRASTCRWRT